MPTKKTDFDTVRSIALDLSGVEESTTYGTPCLKAGGKLMAYIAIHRSAEPGTLAVRVDVDSRPEMITDAPDVYYLTDHYRNYPFVLVRLARIDRQALKDLLHTAWRLARTRTRATKAALERKAPRKSE